MFSNNVHFCKKKFFDLQHGTNKSMYIPNLDDSVPSSKKFSHYFSYAEHINVDCSTLGLQYKLLKN